MIRITYCREDQSVRICGHAGAGEPGKDLVCCAVSTVAQCMVHVFESLVGGIIKRVEAKVEPGDFYVRAVPCEYRRITALTIYDTFKDSLQFIADNNSEYIQMEEEK